MLCHLLWRGSLVLCGRFQVDRFRGRLLDFTSDVFVSLTRAGWRERADCYLRGLMLDGERKSIQPMAARLVTVHDQALNHFRDR